MRAVLCRSLDGPDSLEIAEISRPEADQHQVVIRVRACGLNFLDTLLVRGKYQFKPELPFSPGGEIAGEICSVGSAVSDLAVGDRVCAFVSWGGLREEVSVNAPLVVRLPDDVTFESAAAISVAYGTAMHGLNDRGRLQPGETVVVLGASGGAGLAAVEIAKLCGARVIAAASSSDKLEVCRAHGADFCVNYTADDLKQSLRDLTENRGVDVVYDCVGGPYAEPALRAIAWLGRYLVVGFAAGEIPTFPLNLLLLKSCDVIGVFWGQSVTREPQQHRKNIEEVLNWIQSGRLKPRLDGIYPLERAAEAIKLLDQRRVRGKLVVTI